MQVGRAELATPHEYPHNETLIYACIDPNIWVHVRSHIPGSCPDSGNRDKLLAYHTGVVYRRDVYLAAFAITVGNNIQHCVLAVIPMVITFFENNIISQLVIYLNDYIQSTKEPVQQLLLDGACGCTT